MTKLSIFKKNTLYKHTKKYFFKKTKKIKIISGKWRGRKISVIQDKSIRPTTSLMRETLFNWIHPFILNTVCLDCFAGSGALGLESLSRGSKKVTFIDNNFYCITELNRTMRSLQEYKSKVIHGDSLRWLQNSQETYDIIFIDPPFQNYTIIPKTIFF